ncbi:class I SAM-dependent methyltransferase [Natrarchaeobaculum aegyptiacum]|uniref:SAM-dependent methyltransferase n=1 Tax=Natrarchaeobaculum aegyptiacum TaxID=745377 RepID=A0A2Z2HT51_9EURY|nr:class I SAM-dependent methyltransferase [Natrarchaeobaculum aegyptiacum]ARS90359.1 SAM-dependent methyltransferase [Natrarchaeobaculum aegyptiacum]
MDGQSVGQYFDDRSDSYTRDVGIDEIESSTIVDGFIDPNCTEGDWLLEIGCGDGLLLEYALESTDVTEGYGIDISASMLPDGNDGRAEYIQGSATDLPLPFQPETFDFVVIGDVLHHLVGGTRSASKGTAQAVLVEAANLLKPGGYLIVKDIYYHSPVGPETLTSHLIFYGLKYFARIAARIDEQAAPGLLVSFYTRDELTSLLSRSGTTIVAEEIEKKKQRSIPRRLLIGESGCIRLYARREERSRFREE